MSLKSSWIGPENCTPINSSAISELKANAESAKYTRENDFRVICNDVETLFDAMEHVNNETTSVDHKTYIDEIKDEYYRCNKYEYFITIKVVNTIIYRLNKLSSKAKLTKRINDLFLFFYKELNKHPNEGIKQKANSITFPAGLAKPEL